MKDDKHILSYISRTSPSILTSVHNVMDEIFKSLLAHGYEVCPWNPDRLNDEITSLLECVWYDEKTCKYAIMMETSMITIATNISDAIAAYVHKYYHMQITGFETRNTFLQYYHRVAEHKNLYNAFIEMRNDLFHHGFNECEIFQMLQDIIKERAVICQDFDEKFYNTREESSKDSKEEKGIPHITMDLDKKTNRIGIHIVKNNADSKPDKIELFDATDYDKDSEKGNSGVGKFPDWLKKELEEIKDFQDSYDEDDDDDEEELTQEELIDHAMVCLMDQIDDKIESEVERRFREMLPQYRKMRYGFAHEYPALASFLFGFPF